MEEKGHDFHDRSRAWSRVTSHAKMTFVRVCEYLREHRDPILTPRKLPPGAAGMFGWYV